MEIRLLVIRTTDPKKLADFYQLLGLTFDYHQHGNGPFHYSANLGRTILEIYPLSKTQLRPDKNLRLGFFVDNFELVLQKLREQSIVFLAEPGQTLFGFMAVIKDPDGRKVELYRD